MNPNKLTSWRASDLRQLRCFQAPTCRARVVAQPFRQSEIAIELAGSCSQILHSA